MKYDMLMSIPKSCSVLAGGTRTIRFDKIGEGELTVKAYTFKI